MSLDAMKQALEALEKDSPWREETIGKLRLALEQAERVKRAEEAFAAASKEMKGEKQEPLGYWNAVEGWVELPEETHKPVAWVYPEALEAFQKGQPWTAYGANGSGPNSDGVERIPLYTAPPQRQPLTHKQVYDLEWPADVGGFDDVLSIVRQTERVHGIGGEQEPVAWCPDVCPITGLPFFMWIEHHETGQKVPTYGGPYDSYTIPVRDKDGSYYRERYDHDLGGWLIDEVEDVGVQIVSDQAQPEQEPVAWGYRDRYGNIIDVITPEEHARAEGDYNVPLYAKEKNA